MSTVLFHYKNFVGFWRMGADCMMGLQDKKTRSRMAPGFHFYYSAVAGFAFSPNKKAKAKIKMMTTARPSMVLPVNPNTR
ncbi:hypothetical protein ATG71_1665 [Bacillus sp. es.034]|nr:hypothetical protein ATG71_1665 [Bacillus sp. es.034]